MRVEQIMSEMPYYCGPGDNLGTATSLMWKGSCGFLPVINDGRLAGVITDRDICIALGTRGVPAGEVKVGEVMSKNVVSCAPEDDVCVVLRLMREKEVHRLPVLQNGTLVGVVSIDDVLLRAAPRPGKEPEITSAEMLQTVEAIDMQHVRRISHN